MARNPPVDTPQLGENSVAAAMERESRRARTGNNSRLTAIEIATIRQDMTARGAGRTVNIIGGVVPVPARDLNAEAKKLGFTFESALETLRQASEAGRATTKRAKAKPRGKAKLHWEANPDLRAARLKATYEMLVRESDLANPKLSDEERLSRAGHIRLTYDRLRKLDPSFRDNAEQLRLARKLLNSRNYQRRKAAKLNAA